MPRASGQKYHYLDHDTDEIDETPPIQNTWYEVFHAQDVRLIWCTIYQKNDELAAKDVEVRWTIDGNVYVVPFSLDDASEEYIYRNRTPSTGGTDGLWHASTISNAAYYVDKRGQDFKVEARMTGALGTNQRLRCWCVRETRELT